jgi:hypothetical protein
MDKKGASHIEIILSFLLFLVFIGAAFYFFSPTNTDRITDSSKEYTFREITKRTNSNVQVFSFKINYAIKPDGKIILDQGISLINGNVRAYNKEGISVSAGRTGDYLAVGSNDWSKNDFIKVVVSEDLDFDESLINIYGGSEGYGYSSTPDPSYYTSGSAENKKIISEKKALELKEDYNLDYLGLKKEFNLPGRVNFGFILKINDEYKIESVKEIPQGLEVFSENRKVEVLMKDGKIELADLTIEIW